MPKSMEEETWSRRGRRGRCILKFVIAKAVQFSYVIILGRGRGGGGLSVDTPPWDVINDRSLNSVE